MNEIALREETGARQQIAKALNAAGNTGRHPLNVLSSVD
jgi:hypothetical protein